MLSGARLLSTMALAVTVLGGCRAVSVWESASPTKPLKGIPFYGKTAANKQTTSRVHTWQRATLTAMYVYADSGRPSRKEVAAVHVFDIPVINRSDLSAIQQAVAEFNGSEYGDPMGKVRGIVKVLGSISFVPDTLTLGRGRLMANTVEQVVVTDYSRRLYINSGQSWPGSSKVASELAADGTLSKADATVESKPTELATAIASLFPATSAFNALLGLDKDAKAATLTIKRPVELKLEVTDLGFLDEHSLVVRDTTVKQFAPLTGTEPGVSVVRRSVPWSTKETKKEDAPQIGFEGSVRLPQVKKEEPPK